ncbi:MAG: hypothetical protein ACKVZJ_07370 [Phycisphaerales bacterium]
MVSRHTVGAVSAGLVALLASEAPASLILLSAAAPLSQTGNLVTNGSFEIGAPAPASTVFWANPSFPGNTVPPGWAATGTPQTYATWGSDPTPATGIRGSAPLPHGTNGLYFGNFFTDVSTAPTHLPTGRVNFSTPPVFTPSYGGPVTLTQTVNTQFTPAPMYRVSFWVSGEDSGIAGNGFQRGVMGFQMTNVLAGDPIQYLTVPNALIAPNSRVYTFEFTPLNPTLPVDINFINWGHITTINGVGSGLTTELVLDNVIINAVPAPGVGGVVLVAAGSAFGRRRSRRA